MFTRALCALITSLSSIGSARLLMRWAGATVRRVLRHID
jgi:hypothetical protein